LRTRYVPPTFLALWHDSQETRTGGPPHTVDDYLTKPDSRQITADQTEKLPQRPRELIRRAIDEYESRQSAEALYAKDVDKPAQSLSELLRQS
jgi:putative hydrolase of HD superfamily